MPRPRSIRSRCPLGIQPEWLPCVASLPRRSLRLPLLAEFGPHFVAGLCPAEVSRMYRASSLGGPAPRRGQVRGDQDFDSPDDLPAGGRARRRGADEARRFGPLPLPSSSRSLLGCRHLSHSTPYDSARDTMLRAVALRGRAPASAVGVRCNQCTALYPKRALISPQPAHCRDAPPAAPPRLAWHVLSMVCLACHAP